MKNKRVLNLYAGIGGNRKLWENVEVTAVEIDPKIGKIYQDFFPEDTVIVGDAHQYLLDHFGGYDFVWSSPPCPTHSRTNFFLHPQGKIRYPGMSLYQEIIFLKHWFKGDWVVENVISYYDPLIRPYIYKEHYFWTSFVITGEKRTNRHHYERNDVLSKIRGFDLSSYGGIDKRKILRNCVDPKVGLALFKMAFHERQETLKK